MIDARVLHAALERDEFWATHFSAAWYHRAARVHLAIFLEPFLQYVLNGTKTVDSRFSVNASVPYGRASENDVLLLKRSGGPIVGICRAADVWQYELDPQAWKHIERRFALALCVRESDFLKRKAHTKFATLIRLDSVRSLPPILAAKSDRRGWVVLRDRDAQDCPAES